MLTFFGLTPVYKNVLLEEIFTLCYFGEHGFTHDEVYSIPIRYRHYYLKKVSEWIEKKNELSNPNQSMTLSKKPRDPLPIPDFAFKARAPKK